MIIVGTLVPLLDVQRSFGFLENHSHLVSRSPSRLPLTKATPNQLTLPCLDHYPLERVRQAPNAPVLETLGPMPFCSKPMMC